MPAPSQTTVPNSKLIFSQIRKDVAQYEQILAGIKSPTEKHEKDVKDINIKLAAAWDRVFRIQNLSERLKVQEEIQGYASELERLEINHKASLAASQTEYERRYDAIVREACATLAPSISAGLGSPDSHRSTDPPPASNGTGQNGPVELQVPKQPPSAELGSTEVEAVQDAETRKRKRDSDSLDQESERANVKRQRSSTGKKSVQFDEVFQDGKAPIKHIIVQWPPERKSWYIIRCEEHDLNFKDNPLSGGAAHLRGRKHGKKSDFNAVVEAFGIEVLGCDESLTERNNAESRDAFKNGYEHPDPVGTTRAGDELNFSQQGAREGKKDEAKTRNGRGGQGAISRSGHSRQHKTAQEAIDPKYGNVYLVYWKMSKQWLAALLLPMGKLEDVGIPGSIRDLGLLEDLPQCYAYDSQNETYSWNEGYEDGGPKAPLRQFPVMFFDGSPFPSKSSVAWVSATDLQDYNTDAKNLIEHNQLVLDYLEQRKTLGKPNTVPKVKAGDIINLDSDDDQVHILGSPVSAPSQHQKSEVSPRTAMKTPPVDSHIIHEEASTIAAMQTTADGQSLEESQGQCPEDSSNVADLMYEELAPDTNEITNTTAPSAECSPGGGQNNGEHVSPALTTEKAQTVQPPPGPNNAPRGSLGGLEVAEVALLALDMVNEPCTVQGPLTNTICGAQDLSSSTTSRIHKPAAYQVASMRTPTQQSAELVAGQESQLNGTPRMNATTSPPTIVNLPQPGFSRKPNQAPYAQLPPIRPLEESTTAQGTYWPNRASVSVSSADSPNVWSNAPAGNVPTLPLFGVLMPPESLVPPAPPTLPANPASSVPPPSYRSLVEQAQADDARQRQNWLTNFPPALVDQLKRGSQMVGRELHLKNFINSEGDFVCPFCLKVCARLAVFCKHMIQRCAAARSPLQTGPYRAFTVQPALA
ncbi:hypothetical protein BGZ63DRAFT_422870 [Mariannaea sp. PMI_226]|nr:hypothetical protein BGZ63DRAFT_422870 [Mariannaea sp. PMI_226]